MSHGHGGGCHGGNHGGHGGVHGGGGGDPQSSMSWNMAYAGSERSGPARFSLAAPWPVYFGLIVFIIMLVPFVLDWDEPHLQRLLIGRDLTAKEIAHDRAVDQAMAGTMRTQMQKAFGEELGGQMLPEPGPVSGSALIGIGAPDAPSSIPENNATPTGIGNFDLSGLGQSSQSGQADQTPVREAAEQPPQNAQSSYAEQAQQYQRPYQDPYGRQYTQPPAQYAQPQPYSSGFSGSRSNGGGSGSDSYNTAPAHAQRHRVTVDR